MQPEPPLRPRPATTRRGTFEASSPGGFAFGAVDVWRLLVTWEGVPRAYLELADPGATESVALADGVLRRAADVGRRRAREIELLAARMGVPELDAPRPTCTVVMCTHRRPQLAAQALEALGRLDPPADEILVVDNDPGELDCRSVAEAAGARYIVERRRGQDWARTTGLAAATSELVAFVDDDVFVSAGWLRALPRLFSDPAVGAATGVTVGRTLSTRAQCLRESFAGLVPGMEPQQFDWTTLRPVGSGRAGAGANMIFRRSLLLDLGDVFPAELEVGTQAGSGGDLYVLYRVLAAGRRIAFDPALYAEHEHPPGEEDLRRTVVAYGTGFSAFLTKVLFEDRELGAVGLWWWLAGRYAEAFVWNRLDPRPDELQLRADYLRGGLRGAPAWVRSHRAQRGRRRPTARDVAAQVGVSAPEDVTVIRTDSVAERNRAARAATGKVLLFLAAETEPAPDLPERHLARHGNDDPDRIVIGYVEPLATVSGLAAQIRALERFDSYRARREAAALTYADITADNVSIGRPLFLRLGGFDEALSAERTAQELGLRALEQGATLGYAPDALARTALTDRTREALSRQRRAGADDALIARRHPHVKDALPLAIEREPSHAGLRGALLRLLAGPPAATLGLLLADALEAMRLRRSWLRVYSVLARAAYRAGWRGADPPPPVVARRRVDLAASDPIEPPTSAAGAIDVHIGATDVGTFLPPRGQWSRAFAERIVGSLGLDALGELERMRDPWAPPDVPPELDGCLVLMLAAQGHGGAEDHWPAIAGRVATADEPVVALLMPGVRAGADWLHVARAPLDGDRVALVVGAGVPAGAAPAPTQVASRHVMRGRFSPFGHPAQFVLLSTRKVAQLGGLDPGASRFGVYGPVLDLIQRALDAGMVIAYQEAPGLEPPGAARPERSRLAWHRATARGGLLAAEAVDRGGLRGAAFLAAHLLARPAWAVWPALRYGTPGWRSLAGTTAGELTGCALALTRRRAPSPGSTSSATSPASP